MLQVDDLDVTLDADAGWLRAVEGVSLALARGETVALVGESGCGKSMTALALMRLVPENGAVTRGEMALDGDDLLALPEREMRRVRGGRIGMIFQEPSTSLNPVLTVGVQLMEAIETHTALRGAAARAKAIEWLGRVGLPEPARRIDEYPFRLSGGQKQRVMIAMTLAAEPDYLVADEPTTALDVTIQRQILDLLRQLQREQQLGLLLITHDLAVVAGMAQHVALMYAGQIVEMAPAADFFAAPRHPYARLLLQAVPDAAQRGRPLAAIGGTVPALTQRFTACRFAPRCPLVHDACRQGEPALITTPDGRAVRCVLQAEGRMASASVGLGDASISADGGVAAAPVASDTPLLRVRHLSVAFPVRSGVLQRAQREFVAVDDVSFDIEAGQTVALVGESGCGKTTLGKALLQLLRGTARVGGDAWLNGQPLFTLQGEALRTARRDVQIIFQDPFASLNPRLRVAEILEEGLLTLRPELDAAARRERITHWCERVGLPADALQRYPHEFSGGQRQRLAIARALAVEPRLVVCDEPTSALDVSVQAQILNLLHALQCDTGVSLLFITHNLGVVAYLAQHVVVMQGGRVVEAGLTERVLAAPREAYTRELLAAVPRMPEQRDAGR